MKKTGIKPRVNEAKEFLEIAKDFKDPKEIIREALSNSWDAAASKAVLKFDLVRIDNSKKKKIMVEISDDGNGISTEVRPGILTSELEDFFNLGDSNKSYGSIGTKGHGTKIYYKSNGIALESRKNGKYLKAQTEVPPWETLKSGKVPTYWFEESESEGKGTRIIIDGFEARQTEFQTIDKLIEYIMWYTVVGSFGHYFGNPKRLDVELKTFNSLTPISIPYGFRFPDESTDLTQTTNNFCKLFGPKNVECGETEDGMKVNLEIVGAILGESKREFVTDTYNMMGLWFCKDYIKVEKNNKIIEDIFGGQYYYRSLLIFANCQQFDLTANRNNIRTDDESYNLAISKIKEFIKEIHDDQSSKDYLARNKSENDEKDAENKKEDDEQRRKEKINIQGQRINGYKGRADLNYSINGAPIKEPKTEAETALLLQAMISTGHPGIDFRIGEYSTYLGVDLIIEYVDKGIPTLGWCELVESLEKLYQWYHPPEGIHKIVCYEIGNVQQKQKFQDGKESTFSKKEKGRYNLVVGVDTLDVYVLKEILQSKTDSKS